MSASIEAVYEGGVFRPLTPVALPEHQRVTVSVPADPDHAHFTLPADRWDEFWAALDAPPRDIPALRALLTGPSAFDGQPAAR